MDYQQLTLAYDYEDEDETQSVETVLTDDAAGDLTHVLTKITDFLRAAGFTYVTQLVAISNDCIEHSGEQLA